MRYGLLSFGMAIGVLFAAPRFVVAADLETIQARGFLIIGVKSDWRPLGFTDNQGELVGFEIDIATHLAEELFDDPTAVVLQPLANRDRLAAVMNNEVDMAIAGVAVTPMRTRVVNFSLPYYLDGTALITQQSEIESITDLNHAAIAVINGSDAVPTLQYYLPQVLLQEVTSYQAALEASASGQVEAVAGDVTVLTGWVQEYPEYRLLPEVLTAEPLAIVLPKGTAHMSLLRFVNESIATWHQEGWLEEKATFWGLP